MEFAVRLCFLLGISETIATKSHQHDCPNKEDGNEHAKMDGGKPVRLQPYTKKYS